MTNEELENYCKLIPGYNINDFICVDLELINKYFLNIEIIDIKECGDDYQIFTLTYNKKSVYSGLINKKDYRIIHYINELRNKRINNIFNN